MFLIKLLVIFTSLILLYSCNTGKTDEEMDELWSKAQTTGQIIKRSGSKMNPSLNKNAALRDAETRLQTGGGLFGKKGLSLGDLMNPGSQNQNQITSIGMRINIYLWQGALDTISFMPLNSADPIGGTIITDWYSVEGKENERCKLNIFISGSELKTQNLKVSSFCQNFENDRWIVNKVNKDNNIKLENAILNKAKKLKLQSS
tara:strand:+ start:10984 stop:11592 length:609 start_codon:yes stop_codon:yes gene_type:complete